MCWFCARIRQKMVHANRDGTSCDLFTFYLYFIRWFWRTRLLITATELTNRKISETGKKMIWRFFLLLFSIWIRSTTATKCAVFFIYNIRIYIFAITYFATILFLNFCLSCLFFFFFTYACHSQWSCMFSLLCYNCYLLLIHHVDIIMALMSWVTQFEFAFYHKWGKLWRKRYCNYYCRGLYPYGKALTVFQSHTININSHRLLRLVWTFEILNKLTMKNSNTYVDCGIYIKTS